MAAALSPALRASVGAALVPPHAVPPLLLMAPLLPGVSSRASVPQGTCPQDSVVPSPILECPAVNCSLWPILSAVNASDRVRATLTIGEYAPVDTDVRLPPLLATVSPLLAALCLQLASRARPVAQEVTKACTQASGARPQAASGAGVDCSLDVGLSGLREPPVAMLDVQVRVAAKTSAASCSDHSDSHVCKCRRKHGLPLAKSKARRDYNAAAHGRPDKRCAVVSLEIVNR